MKRLGSSDSLGALITICPTTTTVDDDEHSPRNNHVYGREFQSMLEGLDEEELSGGGGGGHQSEKKRRLSVDQVKALEKNFEVENKLEPDRKVKLAQELGLQPRQVAVWFQNRRARWKTKQLERDYGVLKANYDSLKLNFDSLQRDNQSLLKEVKELKSRLEEEEEENSESYDVTVKEEMITVQEESTQPLTETAAIPESDSKDCFIGGDGMGAVSGSLLFAAAAAAATDLKDGSSDSSDSSAILNEENINNNNNNSSSDDQNAAILMSPANCSSSSMSCFQFQTQYHVKMEEHNFFSADEACNFFSDEQAPTLQQLYCSDEWN